MDVLKINEWLLVDKLTPRYRVFKVEGWYFIQRYSDSEIFQLGQRVFRYGVVYELAGLVQDRVTIRIKKIGSDEQIYTSVGTISQANNT